LDRKAAEPVNPEPPSEKVEPVLAALAAHA
jgi:hypothetical protein